jgi:hypothetical protein
VGEVEDSSEPFLVAFDQTFAGSSCSLWTSGIWPSGCFSHEQHTMIAAAAMTVRRSKQPILRWHSYQPLMFCARRKRGLSWAVCAAGAGPDKIQR